MNQRSRNKNLAQILANIVPSFGLFWPILGTTSKDAQNSQGMV